MKEKVIILTNCSQRKRGGRRRLQLSQFRKTKFDLPTLARHWSMATREAQRAGRAEQVYLGRSVSEAKQVRDHLNADLYFVSAGLGLVQSDQKIPYYDATIVDGKNSLHEVIKAQHISLPLWWAHLGDGRQHSRPISQLIESKRPSLVLVALPSSYLKLVAEDLRSLRAMLMRRIRVFTSEKGRLEIPDALRAFALPYDARLDDPRTRYAGTQTDFPQRAMRHFICENSS